MNPSLYPCKMHAEDVCRGKPIVGSKRYAQGKLLLCSPNSSDYDGTREHRHCQELHLLSGDEVKGHGRPEQMKNVHLGMELKLQSRGYVRQRKSGIVKILF